MIDAAAIDADLRRYATPDERAELDALLSAPMMPPLRYRSLHPKQQAFVDSVAKRKIIRAGRRGGKTVGVAQAALRAFDAGQRVLYAAPTEDQVKRFWFEVKRGLQPRIDANLVYKNETEHVLERPKTMNRIRAKTAWNADTLRGDYADLLILDEWQLMNEDAWELVGAPMLLDNNGDAIFIYTPPSIRTVFTSKARDKRHAAKLYKKAEADTTGRWQAFHFTSHDNPFVSTEALSDIVKDMSHLAYDQEIMAEDKETVPGALWSHETLDAHRVAIAPHLVRCGVAMDPAATSSATADEMGIIAGGIDARKHGYVVEDQSLRGTPMEAARRAIQVYDRLQADAIIVEVNNGGEWIETTINLVAAEMFRNRDRAAQTVNVVRVTATRGKQTRAEPVSALDEQGRIHHVGAFQELEEQLCSWVPGQSSPDRLDARVWLFAWCLVGALPTNIAPRSIGVGQSNMHVG